MVKKKFKILSFLSLLVASFSFIGFVSNNQNETQPVEAASATDVDSYYSSLYDSSGNLKYTGSTLKSKLNTLISTGHTNKTYDDLASIYKTTDVSSSSSSKVVLYYTGEQRTWNFSSYASYDINREHVWCRSHFGTSSSSTGDEQTTPESDAHQVRPCDASLNSSRSNSYYDELSSYTSSDSYGNKWSNGLFYPQADYRGDVARICFYVATRYTNLGFVDGATTGATGTNYKMGNISALMKWNLLYDVSSTETKRNEAVAKIQGNRNPFIDHPEYAAYIWKDFNSTTKSIVDQYTYNITFNTNGGSSISTQEVLRNAKVVKPTNPTKSGTTFVGWYKNSSLTTAYDFSSKVTGDLTLYAKWADGTTGDSSSSGSIGNATTTEKGVIDFTAQGFSNAEVISQVIDSSNTVTATIDKGTSSYTPKYYEDGNALRVYAGNTITIKSTEAVKSIELVFGTGDGTNTITTNYSTFDDTTDTWTATGTNTKNIIFTIGGTTGNRRIQQMKVNFYNSSSSEETTSNSSNIDFTAQGYENGQVVTSVNDSTGSSTITFDTGSGSTSTKYYTSGSALRVYGGNTIKVSSTKNIKNIKFTFGTSDGTNTISANVGTFVSPLWTASDENTKEVIFSLSGTSGNRRITDITITFYDNISGGDSGSTGGDSGNTETNLEPSHIQTDIANLSTNKPTSYSGTRIYEVSGYWKLSTTSSTASTYGNGSIDDGNGYSIAIYGLSSSKSASVIWDSANSIYKYTNAIDFSSLGINDGDYIKVGLIYASSYDNYYAFYIGEGESASTDTNEFAKQTIETQLGFSYRCEEKEVSNTSTKSVVMDLTAQNYANQEAVTGLTKDGVTATFSKGTGKNDPKYYTNGTSLRFYANNTITISSSSNIKKIVLGFGTSDGTNVITANVGTYSSGTWTGSSTSVTFTLDSTTGTNRRLVSITTDIEQVVEGSSIQKIWSFDNFYLRFRTFVSEDVFTAQDENASYGLLINLSSNVSTSFNEISNAEFDATYTSANKYLNIPISSSQIKYENGSYVLSASLTNIPNTQLGTNVTAVFYVRNSETVSFSKTTSKSVKSIVDEYLSNTNELTTIQIEALNALKSSY